MDNRRGNAGSKPARDIPHPTLGMLTRVEAAKLLGICYDSFNQRLANRWKKEDFFCTGRKKDGRGRPPLPKGEGPLVWREPRRDYNPEDELIQRLSRFV